VRESAPSGERERERGWISEIETLKSSYIYTK